MAIIETIAIGTEILLGQSIDSNSPWVGARLASFGFDCYRQNVVGDNTERISQIIQESLLRSDAVIIGGGLGPTQDDITRQALADALGVELVFDPSTFELIKKRLDAFDKIITDNNKRQALVPVGASIIAPMIGTAPGLIFPVPNSAKVIYCLPGVPKEMKEMLDRAVLSDLISRFGSAFTIQSRSINTWGIAESELAQLLSEKFNLFEQVDDESNELVKMAFLASVAKGVQVRLSVKAISVERAKEILDTEEKAIRDLVGSFVYGVDEQTIQGVVGQLCGQKKWNLALAESVTGGMISSLIVSTEKASAWFKGCLVSYDSRIKWDVLDLPQAPVVTPKAARQMAVSASKLLKSDIGIGVTGVAGPDEQEGKPVGMVYCAISLPGGEIKDFSLFFSGDRNEIRLKASLSVLNLLRLELSSF